jgi:hypothetical protein
LGLGRRTGGSHASGSSEADRDLSVLEDDRDVSAARELDHALELFLVLFDVQVPDVVLPPREVLTGRGRVGSGVLAEDLDALRSAHIAIIQNSSCLTADS